MAIAMMLLLGAASCNRVPSNVIKPDKMARLMADMRMADAVVSVSPDDYVSADSKLILKEAVLRHNGVSEEQFDTSLVWYGHHMDRYQTVTEKTIEILQQRMNEANVLAAGDAAMSVAGDSVDLWNGPLTYTIRHNSPSEYITFAMDSDANWEKGDIYTLRAHAMTPAARSSWAMTMTYADGTVESTGGTFSSVASTRQDISLHTDSARVPTRISGWIRITPDNRRPSIIDSISLTRKRIDPEKYVKYNYQQRRIVPREVKAVEDSLLKTSRDSSSTSNEKSGFLRTSDIRNNTLQSSNN